MTERKRVAAILCFVIVAVFAYSFWIGVQKPPADGGPDAQAVAAAAD